MSRIKNFLRNINYLTKHSLWDDKEAQIAYLTSKILDDGIYEYGLELPDISKLQILDAAQSFALIKKENKSFIRTGDGEVKLMLGMDQPFQKYEKEVADRLIQLLEEPRDDIYVGINRHYFIPLIPQGNPYYYRRNAYDFRNFYMRHCALQAIYIDATFTSYNCDADQKEIEYHYNCWREMFENRDIVVVCGQGILDKLEYDVFELAGTKKYIYGPSKHAWDQHDELIKRIRTEISKDQLLVFILGMAGKAMIPELTDMGYVCWDVGHLAKYYNAYMTGMVWTEENRKKFYAPD